MIKKRRDSREPKKSNWGRNFGWNIEHDGKVIGELESCEGIDMFWDTYIVKSFDEKWNNILTNSKSWDNFKYKSKQFNQYALCAFIGGECKFDIRLYERISMRGLYLTAYNL